MWELFDGLRDTGSRTGAAQKDQRREELQGLGLPAPERNASSPAAHPTGKPSHVSW